MDTIATIRCYNDLIVALRARKDALGLADAVLDDVAGLTPGHTNKCLGPSRERGIGAATLEAYLMALAIDLHMVENAEKLARMLPHYETRSASRVRTNHHIGDRVLSRAMTKLRKEGWRKVSKEKRVEKGRKMNEALTPEQRSARARKASLARWEATHAPYDKENGLTLETLAEMLDVGESTIEGWVARGQFPAPKRVGPNAMRRWSWVEVQRHIEGPEDDAATDLIGRIKNGTGAQIDQS